VRRGACAAAGGLARSGCGGGGSSGGGRGGDGGVRAVSRDRGGDGKERKKVWGPRLEGKWRASKNGGWEGEFGGACKMVFYPKPLNFGVVAHIEAPTGLALTLLLCGPLLIRD
jgi:hypothetical protein